MSSEVFVVWRPTLRNLLRGWYFSIFPSFQLIAPVWSSKALASTGNLEFLGSCVCLTQTEEEQETTKFKLLALCYTKKKKVFPFLKIAILQIYLFGILDSRNVLRESKIHSGSMPDFPKSRNSHKSNTRRLISVNPSPASNQKECWPRENPSESTSEN